MVTTRSGGESTKSPTKPTAPKPPTTTTTRTTKPSTSSSSSPTKPWTHTPRPLTLLWLTLSTPLVLWDAGYVLLRPHSMVGGKYHSPLWTPYALYAEIDYVYGWKALQENNSWTQTQTWFNLGEVVAYAVYLGWVLGGGYGKGGRRILEGRTLEGRRAAWAVLVGFSAASLTFYKTVMYWLLEYLSGFENIGHNDWTTLITMWIIPNGAWLIGPSYMMYVFGGEILQGLEMAATATAPGSTRKTK